MMGTSKQVTEAPHIKVDDSARWAMRAKWEWAEGSIWTDAMLTALENGVKGGKWFIGRIRKAHLVQDSAI